MTERKRVILTDAQKARKRQNSREWYTATVELIARHRGEFLRILNDKRADTDEQRQ